MENRLYFKVLLFLLIFCGSVNIFSQNVSVSPNEDGELEPQLVLNWTYGETDLNGLLRVRTHGKESIQTAQANGLPISFTTISDEIFIEAMPLIWSYSLGDIKLNPGLGIAGERYSIQEVGFIDLDTDPVTAGDQIGRLFLSNDREIYAIRPGAFAGTELESDAFNLQFNAFYSPFFFVNIEQELSSACAEAPSLNTSATTNHYSGTGQNAWGAFSSFSWKNEFIDIISQTSWEGYSLSYDYLWLGGDTATENVDLIKGGFDILCKFNFIEVSGSAPLLGAGWLWSFTKAAGSSEWKSAELPVRIYLGIGF